MFYPSPPPLLKTNAPQVKRCLLEFSKCEFLHIQTWMHGVTSQPISIIAELEETVVNTVGAPPSSPQISLPISVPLSWLLCFLLITASLIWRPSFGLLQPLCPLCWELQVLRSSCPSGVAFGTGM